MGAVLVGVGGEPKGDGPEVCDPKGEGPGTAAAAKELFGGTADWVPNDKGTGEAIPLPNAPADEFPRRAPKVACALESPPKGEGAPPIGAGTEFPNREGAGAGLPNADAGVVVVFDAGIFVNGDKDAGELPGKEGPRGGFWLPCGVSPADCEVVSPPLGNERFGVALSPKDSRGFFVLYFFASLANMRGKSFFK